MPAGKPPRPRFNSGVGTIGISERHHNISDLPRQLAVFPLRGVILLPRSDLPLNVFEPRYLKMIDDVLGNGRYLGILQPQISRDNEQASSESPRGKNVALRTIGTLGRLSGFQETDDGRYIISITGIVRFRVTDEQESDKPYRICGVNYDPFTEDLIGGCGEEHVDRQKLLTALKNYLQAKSLEADWQAIENASNESLVNSLSMISPYGPEEKQALLEADGLKARSEVLIALAEMDLAARDDDYGSAIQ